MLPESFTGVTALCEFWKISRGIVLNFLISVTWPGFLHDRGGGRTGRAEKPPARKKGIRGNFRNRE
jgi:hypothetical protein